MQLQFPSWYTTPTCQVVLIGITCFATVGMFNAVSDLGAGAGGFLDPKLSYITNGLLYAMFVLTGIFSGRVCNVLGHKLTLFLGTLGYALFLGALCFQMQGNRGFLIFATAILGVTGALLWTVQGSVMMSSPLENDKGKSFSIFWAIFQLGTFIGSVTALAIEIRSGKLQAVATSTYIGFLVIILVGIASAFLVLPPNRIIRADGTVVSSRATLTFGEEFKFACPLLPPDWPKLALLPMWFASNYFYAYQGAINVSQFDRTTTSLNAVLSTAGTIVGAIMMGYFVLDWKHFGRRTRGYIGLAAVAVMTIIVWACALGWQVTFSRKVPRTHPLIYYKDEAYRGKGALFFFFYYNDACFQALAYWIISAFSNDPFKLARLAGYYKSMQALGAAISFVMDVVETPFLNEHLASWLLMISSLLIALISIRSIKETNYDDEQVVYVDDLKNDQTEKGSTDGRRAEM